MEKTKGKVIKAFGNLLHVEFTGILRQGEVGYVFLDQLKLKAEVIEIKGNQAKMQVFEDTTGIKWGTEVEFEARLLEAELGPGLLGSIVDGLQNPLEKIADSTGIILQRGVYIDALDRQRKWNFEPLMQIGDSCKRGDALGYTMEGRFKHFIFVPFTLRGNYKLHFVAKQGSYTIEECIAVLKTEEGEEISVSMLQKWPIKVPLIAGEKVKAYQMMDVGERIIDTQFPVLKGGSFCTPGPFGAGKTVIQHHLSKYASVDIVIFVACGERAGEVVEVLKTFPHLVDPHTSDPLMERTIIVCNTSSMPVAAREASIYMGTTLAEYYRQMGLDVLLLADSTSRWAQAMREMSGRLEEIPGEEAFPAYLSSRIAAFYERSGVVISGGREGSLTIGGTVSPAGGNFEEPVTQATLAVVGAFWGLSRRRSDARKYPAIDPEESWTKYLEEVSKELSKQIPGWGSKVKKTQKLLIQGSEIGKRMEVVGEEGVTLQDFILYLKAELYDFCYLQQNAFDKEDSYCPLPRQLALFTLMEKVLDASFRFEDHDTARSYFLDLQNTLKNLNYIPFDSHRYKTMVDKIEEKIEQGVKGSIRV